jgi:LmbE family N-acetylglucosaminyl deacetylase
LQRFGELLREAGIEVPFGREAEEAIEAGSDPPFGVPDERVTTTVDVSGYVGPKRAALEAHATQMGPEQFFMRIPQPLFAEIFGRETFQRVVGPGETPETDLFSNLTA